MEGVKLVVNKVLSSHFQVAHTVHMSALGLPGYHLHTAYAGDWQLSPTEVRAPPHSRQLCKTHMDVGLENLEMCVISNYVLSASSERELVLCKAARVCLWRPPGGTVRCY